MNWWYGYSWAHWSPQCSHWGLKLIGIPAHLNPQPKKDISVQVPFFTHLTASLNGQILDSSFVVWFWKLTHNYVKTKVKHRHTRLTYPSFSFLLNCLMRNTTSQVRFLYKMCFCLCAVGAYQRGGGDEADGPQAHCALDWWVWQGFCHPFARQLQLWRNHFFFTRLFCLDLTVLAHHD